MCGIAGFCNYSSTLTLGNLKTMTDILSYRGPDDAGYKFIELKNCNVGLGHRRLSILDLTTNGHQPYSYKNLVLVYNGEVYNFKEIRKELISLNYKFKSNGDTEVIVKAFHKWGIKCVDKFIGMFAFTIFDKNLNKLYIFRDRTGVKPLFYYLNGETLLFASELKSFMSLKEFKKDIDKTALMLYFKYGYIPSPYSIFKDTHKLEAGHYIEFDIETKEFKKTKYWDVADFYNKPKLNISFNKASKKLEKLLISAFNYRTISDVSLGVFLSGGYDSSAVTSIIQSNSKAKIKTFTIGFNDKEHNEAEFAKEVAKYLGTEHYEHYCTEEDALNIIPKLSNVFDEPFGDTSAIPMILVSKFAKEKVTVALSGDGGDELFSGYDLYHNNIYENYKLKIFNKLSLILKTFNPKYLLKIKNIYNLEGKYYKFSEFISKSAQLDRFNTLSKYFYDEELGKLLNFTNLNLDLNIFKFNLVNQDNNRQELLLNSYKTYLPDDILVKVDRATMSVGLEGREPLLDHRIIEFVAQLPYKYKYKNGTSKVILKNVVHKYIPKDMINRKKLGFSIPLDKWLKGGLKKIVLETLDRAKQNQELFNKSYIDDVINSFYKYSGNPYKLWLIFIFQLWYERWVDE
jgi:asparagine synthase (glutamine-hydrolysing)